MLTVSLSIFLLLLLEKPMGKIKSAKKLLFRNLHWIPTSYRLQKASKLGGNKTILVANLLWMFWSMKYLKKWLAGEKTQNVVFLNDFAAGGIWDQPCNPNAMFKKIS